MVHERKVPSERLLQQVRVLWNDFRLLWILSSEVAVVLVDKLGRAHYRYVFGLRHVAENPLIDLLGYYEGWSTSRPCDGSKPSGSHVAVTI